MKSTIGIGQVSLSLSLPLSKTNFVSPCHGSRPDITLAVDWVLKANYPSIYHHGYITDLGDLIPSVILLKSGAFSNE